MKAAQALPEDDRTLSGVGLMIAFAAVVPAMDILAKLATAEATPAQVALYRFLLQTALVAPLALAFGSRRPPDAETLALLALRGLLMAAATVFFFTALTAMAVADAISIFFVEPMILTLLSALILKEPVGWRRYAACAVGFGGALLIVQPKFQAMGWIAAAPLAAAGCFALYLIVTRRVAPRLGAFAIQVWTGLFGAAALGLAFALVGGATFRLNPLSNEVWAMVFFMGAFGALGHLALVAAFARAPASVLAPFQYLEIVAATALGYAVFGDFPDALTWLGITIIVGSGMLILHRERVASRRRTTARRPASGSR